MAVEVQKVAVIGSGAAGLCCARHFTSDPDRFEVQVYEKGDVVGGTWVYSKECGAHAVHSSMYKNLRLVNTFFNAGTCDIVIDLHH